MSYTVSQFIEFVNAAFQSAVFPEGVAIEGEVAEYRVSQDKWIWFLLKDKDAVVSCFATVWQLRTPLEDGMKVRVHGQAKIYPKSGKFSVTVERVELVGEGALRQAYELLKKRLEAEGLFSPERKRPIPRFPRRIGVIASRESAAYTDFLRILGDRWRGTEVRSANVAVQGRDAVREICGAFRWFDAHPDEADVLVLTRGGGALEDLQAFNSEEVARAVFASRIPVIVGVGHERDETLADYVADVRASTPTNAAERVVPDRREILSAMGGAVRSMEAAMVGALHLRRHAISAMTAKIESHAHRAFAAFRHRLQDFSRHFAVFAGRVSARRDATAALGARLAAGAGAWTSRLSHKIDADTRLLATLDPRRPLQKGYALVKVGGRLLKDAALAEPGALLDIQLAQGALTAEVKGKQ